MSKEETIKALLLDKINLLVEITGIEVTKEQFQNLLNRYVSSSSSLFEITNDIERQFNQKLAFYKHEQHRTDVIESYKGGAIPLENGQNCYLVSYNTDGQKIIKPSKLTYPEAPLKGNNFPDKVMIDDDPQRTAYRKDSTYHGGAYLDDLEMIYNQIGFMLDINLAKTHRVFNGSMQPYGLISEDPSDEVNERYLSFRELAKIVIDYGTTEQIKEWLQNYDQKLSQVKNNRDGLTVVPEIYSLVIEFILNVIDGLPQITAQNQNELKQAFFDMKVFEIFSGSIENTSAKYGVVVDSAKTPYTYRFAALFEHPFATNEQLGIDDNYLSNSLVNKRELYRILVSLYYPYIKVKSKMILANKEVLLAAIDTIAQDFLDYGPFLEYQQIVRASSQMMAEEIAIKLESETPTTDEQITDATNNEIATSRANAMQRGQNVKKAKAHSLALTDGSAPQILLDDNGKIDKKFLLITSFLIIIIVYIIIMFMVH